MKISSILAFMVNSATRLIDNMRRHFQNNRQGSIQMKLSSFFAVVLDGATRLSNRIGSRLNTSAPYLRQMKWKTIVAWVLVAILSIALFAQNTGKKSRRQQRSTQLNNKMPVVQFHGFENTLDSAYRPNGTYFTLGLMPKYTSIEEMEDQMRRDKMLREMKLMQYASQHMDRQGVLRALGYENKAREDLNTMHQMEIDKVTSTTLAERNTASENNLQRMYPNNGGYGYFGNSSLYRNSLGEVYRINPDGTKYKMD